MHEYLPIPCAQHERLEFSVLRRIPLLMEYQSDGGSVCLTVMPLDVTTRDGAEWLKFMTRGSGNEIREIRLDAIISFVEAMSS